MPALVSTSPIGPLVARYRKLAKMSAEDLARTAGHGLTRSIVANLENGRKEDVTTSQLLAIAFALDVAPVDLLFDVRMPYAYSEIVSSGDGRREVRVPVWLAREWFGGLIPSYEMGPFIDRELMTDADLEKREDRSATSRLIATDLRRRSVLMLREKELTSVLIDIGEPDVFDYDGQAAQQELRDIRAELYTLDRTLRSRGVDIDGVVHPDTRHPNPPF